MGRRSPGRRALRAPLTFITPAAAAPRGLTGLPARLPFCAQPAPGPVALRLAPGWSSGSTPLERVSLPGLFIGRPPGVPVSAPARCTTNHRSTTPSHVRSAGSLQSTQHAVQPRPSPGARPFRPQDDLRLLVELREQGLRKHFAVTEVRAVLCRSRLLQSDIHLLVSLLRFAAEQVVS